MINTNNPPELGKLALVVIGMHRSGTSATTGALRCLGIQLGKKLYTGHQNINAKGYFEHSDIADTNEEALLALSSGWDDILLKPDNWWRSEVLHPYTNKMRQYIRKDFSKSQLWAIKDPRVCRLLPWWLDIFKAENVVPHFLFVVRSPNAVFRSLERRDGISKEKAYLLWTLHYLEAERWSRGHPRTFMDFDDFLEAPLEAFQRVASALDLKFPLTPDQARDCLEQFLDRSLRNHYKENSQDAGTPIIELAQDLHKAMLAAVADGESAMDCKLLESLWQRMEIVQQNLPRLAVEHIHSLALARGKSQLTLNRLVRSWSWLVGKPVRVIERWLGRDV